MISSSERDRLLVGYKQTVRTVKDNKADKVFLAEDCESKISTPIKELAAQSGVQVVNVPTMRELGTMCGVNVSSSCAVVLK